MYLNHYPQQALTVTVNPAYGTEDAEGFLDSMVQGCTSSCAIDEARRVLATLEDGEALVALGFTDADQEWVEEIHAVIKMILGE